VPHSEVALIQQVLLPVAEALLLNETDLELSPQSVSHVYILKCSFINLILTPLATFSCQIEQTEMLHSLNESIHGLCTTALIVCQLFIMIGAFVRHYNSI
jgi:hypothetical protein